jgi:hypothetical protein
MNQLPCCKTYGLMGYFTNEQKGLSTNNGEKLTQIENTVIQLRYGIFDKIHDEWLPSTKSYFIDRVLAGNQSSYIGQFIPNYDEYINKRKFLWKLGRFKNMTRKFLIGLGIWNWLVQKKMYLLGRSRRSF